MLFYYKLFFLFHVILKLNKKDLFNIYKHKKEQYQINIYVNYIMDNNTILQTQLQPKPKPKTTKLFLVRKKKINKCENNSISKTKENKKKDEKSDTDVDKNKNTSVISQYPNKKKDEYLNSLTEIEREVMNIANDHLESSFTLLKSNGFVEFKQS